MTVGAVILAAGRGRRMGGPKHLLEIGGRTMLEHVARALAGSAAAELRIVLGPGDQAGARAAAALGLAALEAESGDEGRAASVRAAVRASPEDHALLFALADQPWLESRDFDRLIARAEESRIVQAHYDGAPGSPVLFGPFFRAELLELVGREGGRVIVQRHPEALIPVELDPERGRDVDRPEDLH